jgi:4-amino-4-deoxy-L-arabinose transferase-like glycosyltransferase
MDLKLKYIIWALLLVYSILIFGLNLKEPGLYSTQEGRAGISARNMLRSDDYTRVHIKHTHNTEKPIFCYWLYALSCKILGFTEIAVRLPSVIAGILTVLMTCWLGMKIYGTSTGFLSGFILSSMISFANQARIARIDVVLTAFFVLCMILFYKGYLEKKKANWILYLFYALLAFSVLVKGPVTVLLAGLIVFFFAWKEKNWKILWEVKPVSGLIIGLLIAAPWFVCEGIKSEGAFTWDFFVNQNIKRFIGGSSYCEGKRKIFIFYFFNLFQGAFPWSVFAPLH